MAWTSESATTRSRCAAAIGEFFDRRDDGRSIADASAAGTAASRARWDALCGIGIPALRVPEPQGIGASLLDSTAVVEGFGAVLLPEPASTTIVLAPVLTALLDGSRVACLVSPQNVSFHADGTLTGTVRIADDGITDLAAVPFDGGLALVERSAIGGVGERSDIDPCRPTALCELGRVHPIETVPMAPDAVAALLREWAVLAVSELVGGMQAGLDATLAYVCDREQFGRSVGSFQSVKHQLADMYVAVEQARAAVQFAAAGCDCSAEMVATDVAAAARWVPASAIALFERAIHLHGAMGYAWDVAMHLHLRRAVATRGLLRESGVTDPQSVREGQRVAS